MKGVVGGDYVEVLRCTIKQAELVPLTNKESLVASVRADLIGQSSQSIIRLRDRCRHKS